MVHPVLGCDTVNRISNRIASIAPSATIAVDTKAKALQAAGEPVIGFGAGEPDFPTPEHIVRAAVAACENPAAYRYTPVPGLPALREAIAVKTNRDSNYDVTADQVLVSAGGKHALAQAFATLLDPGDEVIVPAPYWTSYPEMVSIAGGTPIIITTDDTAGFKVTPAQLDAAKTDRTKALVFVSPSNPTGVVYTPDEVAAIGQWAVANGVWVITDEIYEHLTYGEALFSSMPALVPALADTCIVVNGVAKTYAMTGWRIGWMIAPVDVIKAATNLQSQQTSNISNVAQYAAIAAVSGDLSSVEAMREAFDRRGKRMHALLEAIPGVTCIAPQGAFYCFPNVEGVLGREIAGRTVTSSMELCDVLLDEAKVALVPGEAFGAPGYVRLSFATSDDNIEEGLERIAKVLA
jgi:aspartate/methionine/tyrosine aminotransferase